MYDPMVQLKSGGYLVINPTEALVSIDINSGRSTREHGIEQTALNTNLEAAREIARQLRLRDMAGLVVIDFIDMENSSSIRKVEKAMKEALKNDRARIQVGRISGFGLMEMSRQRLRTGVLEATTRTCPHCDGTGLVRTASSAGLSALRLIEDEAARGKGSLITLYASTEAAIYLLNAKRSDLAEIEARYHVAVEVVPEGEDEGAKMRIQSSGPRPAEAPRFAPLVEIEDEDELPEEDEEEEEEVEAEAEAGPAGREPRAASPRDDGDDDGQKKKRRRRRRGGRGRNRIREQDEAEAGAGTAADEEEDEALSAEGVEAETEHAEGEEPAPRSRRRRGGRGRSRAGADAQASPEAADALEPAVESEAPADEEEAGATAGEAVEAEARPARRRSRRAAPAEGDSGAGEGDTAEAEAEAEAKAAPRPRSRRRKAEPADPAEAGADDAPAPDTAAPAARKRRARTRDGTVDEPAAAEPEPEPAHEGASAANDPGDPGAPTDESGQPRRGWWQRTFGA